MFGVAFLGALPAAVPASSATAPGVDNSNVVSELVVIANRPPTVEELAVVARAECLPAKHEKGSTPPEIVSTYPRRDREIRPGLVILRITFDKPMACSGFIEAPIGTTNPCSNTQHFLMTFDHKTIRVPCVVQAGKSYDLWLNNLNFDPLFTSLQWQRLAPYRMSFKVSSAAPIQTIPDALSADPETVLADVYRPVRKTQASTPTP